MRINDTHIEFFSFAYTSEQLLLTILYNNAKASVRVVDASCY